MRQQATGDSLKENKPAIGVLNQIKSRLENRGQEEKRLRSEIVSILTARKPERRNPEVCNPINRDGGKKTE